MEEMGARQSRSHGRRRRRRSFEAAPTAFSDKQEDNHAAASISAAGEKKDETDTFVFLLSAERQEKESTVLEQEASLETRSGLYEVPDDAKFRASLSESALRLGREVFLRIGAGLMLPERPNGSGERGFYVRGEGIVGFRGVSGKDLSLVWHMLLVPTLAALRRCSCSSLAAADRDPMRDAEDDEDVVSAASSETLDSEGDSLGRVPVRWVFDLRRAHLPLIRAMRRQGLVFLQRNSSYFLQQWRGARATAALRGETVESWLRPERVQFGFHVHPSVGYVHCHMLVGPVTDFGMLPQYAANWVGLDRVEALLEQGRNPRELLLTD